MTYPLFSLGRGEEELSKLYWFLITMESLSLTFGLYGDGSLDFC